MNDTVWIEAQDGNLINLSKVAFIKPYSRTTNVQLIACFAEDAAPLVVAEVDTLQAAQTLLKKIQELIKTNVKCIDAGMLVRQANNDNH